MLSFDLLRMADTAIASQYPEIGRSRRLIFYPNGMATFFKYSGKSFIVYIIWIQLFLFYSFRNIYMYMVLYVGK